MGFVPYCTDDSGLYTHCKRNCSNGSRLSRSPDSPLGLFHFASGPRELDDDLHGDMLLQPVDSGSDRACCRNDDPRALTF